MEFVLKKKKFIFKIKTNLHSVNQKTSKGEKKKKKKTCTTKKNHIEKFETQNLRRCTAALVLVEDTKVTNKKKGKT